MRPFLSIVCKPTRCWFYLFTTFSALIVQNLFFPLILLYGATSTSIVIINNEIYLFITWSVHYSPRSGKHTFPSRAVSSEASRVWYDVTGDTRRGRHRLPCQWRSYTYTPDGLYLWCWRHRAKALPLRTCFPSCLLSLAKPRVSVEEKWRGVLYVERMNECNRPADRGFFVVRVGQFLFLSDSDDSDDVDNSCRL